MKTVVLKTAAGGFVAIDEQNVSMISTIMITRQAQAARIDDKGKTIPALAEQGYIKDEPFKYLSTYTREASGKVTTEWTRLTACPLVAPVQPVLYERRAILQYDIQKKFFVLHDVTEALAQYLAEREAAEAAEKAEVEQIAVDNDDDETAYPVDYASEEEYENAEDSPKYQDDVLLEDIEETDGSNYEVSDTGKLSQIIASSPNIMILRPA